MISKARRSPTYPKDPFFLEPKSCGATGAQDSGPNKPSVRREYWETARTSL